MTNTKVLTFAAICDEQGRLKFTLPDGSIRYGNCPSYIPVGTQIYASFPVDFSPNSRKMIASTDNTQDIK